MSCGLALTLTVLVSIFAVGQCFPDGFPFCTLQPLSGMNFKQQVGVSKIEFNKPCYRPGEIVVVSLSGERGNRFHGFVMRTDVGRFLRRHGSYRWVENGRASDQTCVTHVFPGVEGQWDKTLVEAKLALPDFGLNTPKRALVQASTFLTTEATEEGLWTRGFYGVARAEIPLCRQDPFSSPFVPFINRRAQNKLSSVVNQQQQQQPNGALQPQPFDSARRSQRTQQQPTQRRRQRLPQQQRVSQFPRIPPGFAPPPRPTATVQRGGGGHSSNPVFPESARPHHLAKQQQQRQQRAQQKQQQRQQAQTQQQQQQGLRSPLKVPVLPTNSNPAQQRPQTRKQQRPTRIAALKRTVATKRQEQKQQQQRKQKQQQKKADKKDKKSDKPREIKFRPHPRCNQAADQGQCDNSAANSPWTHRNWTQPFYFDSSAQLCRQFHYTGCGGNDNRFDTIDECKRVCIGGQEACKKYQKNKKCKPGVKSIWKQAYYVHDPLRAQHCTHYWFRACSETEEPQFGNDADCKSSCLGIANPKEIKTDVDDRDHCWGLPDRNSTHCPIWATKKICDPYPENHRNHWAHFNCRYSCCSKFGL